jgi:hypothetical protein
VEDRGPRGAPPKQPLEEAFAELTIALCHASIVYREKGDAGRTGAGLACQAVARFLAVSHLRPEYAVPFLGIQAALRDLESGVSNELFITDGRDVRRSRSRQRKHLQAFASACLDVLVELGEPLNKAAAVVARNANRWQGEKSPAVTATTVKNWRDAQLGASTAERSAFDRMRKDMIDQPDLWKEVRDHLRRGPIDVPKS